MSGRRAAISARAASISSKGVCNAAEIPMIPVDGHDGHFSRCVRFNEIDWSGAAGRRQEEQGAGQARRAGAQDRRPQEILQGRGQRDFRRRRGPRRQGQRDDQLRWRARSETVAIVGESGCGKSTLAKVLLGLETASSGSITLGNKEIQSTGDRDARRRDRVVDPDGVPEPVRHAEPQPFGRLADHPHAGEIQASARRSPTAASACSSCSTW